MMMMMMMMMNQQRQSTEGNFKHNAKRQEKRKKELTKRCTFHLTKTPVISHLIQSQYSN